MPHAWTVRGESEKGDRKIRERLEQEVNLAL